MEGPSDDPAIEELRNRQVKNFLTVTLLSVGLPMILMGDEVRRTQRGNNNDYCHDDESNWFDWTLCAKHADVLRFVQLLCARRVLRASEHERRRITLSQLIQQTNKSWHGVKLDQPDWGDTSHSIAFTAERPDHSVLVHLILNAYREPLEFELPHAWGERPLEWRRWIDTAKESPQDIVPWDSATPVPSTPYRAEPRSVVLLFAGI